MSTVEGKKQEKRRALLDAAYELFLERGTAKTSVEDITSRAFLNAVNAAYQAFKGNTGDAASGASGQAGRVENATGTGSDSIH